MRTTTYQIVTDNSVYEVIDHEFSPGVSVRNRTRFGKLSGDFEWAASACVGTYLGALVLSVYDNDGTRVLRTSPIQSIVRITSSTASDRSNHTPVGRSEWASLYLVGRKLDSRIYGRSATRSLV